MESDDEKRPREEETAAEEPTPFNDVRADVSAERLLQDARLDARYRYRVRLDLNAQVRDGLFARLFLPVRGASNLLQCTAAHIQHALLHQEPLAVLQRGYSEALVQRALALRPLSESEDGDTRTPHFETLVLAKRGQGMIWGGCGSSCFGETLWDISSSPSTSLKRGVLAWLFQLAHAMAAAGETTIRRRNDVRLMLMTQTFLANRTWVYTQGAASYALPPAAHLDIAVRIRVRALDEGEEEEEEVPLETFVEGVLRNAGYKPPYAIDRLYAEFQASESAAQALAAEDATRVVLGVA